MDNKLINRKLLSSITNIFRYFSVLTLTGPCQSGKTTDVENANGVSSLTNTRKLLRDGQIIILRDGKTYTLMGAEIQ